MAKVERLRMVNGDLVGYASSKAQFDKVWAPRGWELQELEQTAQQEPPAGGDGPRRASARVGNGDVVGITTPLDSAGS